MSTDMKLKNVVQRTMDSRTNILVEIVSAYDLVDEMVTKFYDVCCVCHLDSEEIHWTKSIKRTVEPIWTIKTDSLFLLETSTSKLKSVGGLSFSLMHNGGILRSYSCLGNVLVPSDDILSGVGERIEYELEQIDDSTNTKMRPKLALRFRHASESDLKFMKQKSASFHEIFSIVMGEMNKEESYRQQALVRNRTALVGDRKVRGRVCISNLKSNDGEININYHNITFSTLISNLFDFDMRDSR